MPLDAICLGAVTEELNHVLAGCRVEKVYQPDRDEIVLQTRGQGGARRLLVSTAAGAPRVLGIVAPYTGREIETRRYCSRLALPVEE